MGATFSRVKNWVAEILTYTDLNAEFNNILTNLTPAGVDDESTNATAMQATADPYPGATESLATSLQGEIQRLRYVIKQITGETQWYIDPDTTIAAIVSAAYLTSTTGVTKALFDANTILAANSDDTPAALAVAEQRIVGRKTGGNIDDLTITEILDMVGSAADGDYLYREGGVWTRGPKLTIASLAESGGVHTTGSVTATETALTVASGTGIVAGMYVVGEGITPGTYVSTIGGTGVTLSAAAGATLSGDPVSFYLHTKALTPALTASRLCRAWVNFNGSGTVAIRASYNVTSITDHGTGLYTINFTAAMPDANYVIESQAVSGTSSAATDVLVGAANIDPFAAVPAVDGVRIGVGSCYYSASAFGDLSYIFVAIFR